MSQESGTVHILFDLSGTVFGVFDLSLRPGIRETIDSLRAAGYMVDFWTSGRREHYEDLLKGAGITGSIFSKNPALPIKPAICVDDEPEEWMPGHRYKVDIHLAQDMPGSPILVAELMCVTGSNFYWD